MDHYKAIYKQLEFAVWDERGRAEEKWKLSFHFVYHSPAFGGKRRRNDPSADNTYSLNSEPVHPGISSSSSF